MSNMSYCRFENTLSDLRDCQENLFDELSEDEERARRRLLKVCQEIVDECQDEEDESDFDSGPGEDAITTWDGSKAVY